MPRRFLFTALIGFCGGIILAEFLNLPIILVGGAAAVGTLAAGLGRLIGRLQLVSVALLALSLGQFRFTAAVAPSPASISHYDGQDIQVAGQIFELPVMDDRQVVVLDQLTVSRRSIDKKIQIYLPLWPKYRPGQQLRLTCRLSALTVAKYPRQWSHGIQARCFSPTNISVQPSPPSWRRQIARVLDRVVQSVHQNFNQPQSSLLSGILLGSQGAMPEELRQNFQATGTTHIIALSGFNVTIIITTMIQLLVRFVGRRWAWAPGLAVVIVFVIMTGASASVVRAAIMAVVTQFGLFLGRPIAPGRLLSYAAMAMLWHNPLILVHDLGFQLSFLATIGLVFFAEPVASRLRYVPEIFGLRESLSTTLAAILVTEPLLLWRFGRLSLIAPLVNVFVLPLIPVIMGLGVLWTLGQFIHPVIGMVVQPLTDVLLRLGLWIIATGASTSMSQVFLGGWVASVAAAIVVMMIVQVSKNYVPAADRP